MLGVCVWGKNAIKRTHKGESIRDLLPTGQINYVLKKLKQNCFKSKLQKGKPNVNIFIHSLKQRAVIEKYCIAASDQEERHETQPLSLVDLLCLE